MESLHLGRISVRDGKALKERKRSTLLRLKGHSLRSETTAI